MRIRLSPSHLLCLLITLFLHATASRAQIAVGASIFGTYKLNAFGQIRTLDLTTPANGGPGLAGVLIYVEANGTRAADPVSGFYSSKSGQVVLLRLRVQGGYKEAYVGHFSRLDASISGTVHRLDRATDFAATVNDDVFAASKQINQPFLPRPPAVLSGSATPPDDLRGPWGLSANRYPLMLAVTSPGTGVITGRLSNPGTATLSGPDETITGHFAPSKGRFAFLRLSGRTPIQLFVGTATRLASGKHQMSGDFYALTPAAGATTETQRYGFGGNRHPVFQVSMEGSEGCLSKSAARAFATLDPCNTSDSQRIAVEVRPMPGAAVQPEALVTFDTGACLGVARLMSGERVVSATCTYSTNWIFEPGRPSLSFPDYRPYVIGNTLCLGADPGRNPPNRPVVLQPCRSTQPGGTDPIWTFKRLPF